jgi:pimeloyl-ACP methyl ester carboxylesterase
VVGDLAAGGGLAFVVVRAEVLIARARAGQELVVDLQLGVAQGDLGFDFAPSSGDPPVAGVAADEHVNWHIWGHARHDHGPLWRSFLTEQRALVRELADLTASPAQVVQPVLLVADPHDTLIPVSTTHQLAAVLPDARVQLLDQVGHHLPRRGAPRSQPRSSSSWPHWTAVQPQPDRNQAVMPATGFAA